jgi:hypothetical protein
MKYEIGFSVLLGQKDKKSGKRETKKGFALMHFEARLVKRGGGMSCYCTEEKCFNTDPNASIIAPLVKNVLREGSLVSCFIDRSVVEKVLGSWDTHVPSSDTPDLFLDCPRGHHRASSLCHGI